MEADFLPTKCYLCQLSLGSENHPVMQTCACLAAKCKSCATLQLANCFPTYDNIGCNICGQITKSGDNTVIQDIDKVKKVEEELLKRAFSFFGLDLPRRCSDQLRYKSLLDRFRGLECYATLIEDYWDQMVEKDIGSIRLFLARLETLRGGTLESHYELVNYLDPEELPPVTLGAPPTDLPLGPLYYVNLSRNIILEKLLKKEFIDPSCIVCSEVVNVGRSVLFPCPCGVVMCHNCMLTHVSNNPNTYQDGVKCPLCRKYSKISYENIKIVDKEEKTLLTSAKNFLKKNSFTQDKMTEKNTRLMIAMYVSLGHAPKNFTYDENDRNNTNHRARLVLARLEHYRKSEKIADELPFGPLNLLVVKSNPFLDFYLKHSKLNFKEDEIYDNFDWKLFVPTLAKTAEEFLRRDAAINQQTSRSTAIVDVMEGDEEGNNTNLVDIEAFKPLETLEKCPFCPVNPQNTFYLKLHIEKMHNSEPDYEQELTKLQFFVDNLKLEKIKMDIQTSSKVSNDIE